jgi:hypothetical protein
MARIASRTDLARCVWWKWKAVWAWWLLWGRRSCRPDFALNGFLSVGFQTDQKSREKNGDPESVPGLACFDVLCPSNGITGTSTYTYYIWRLHCVAGDMGMIWFYASKI